MAKFVIDESPAKAKTIGNTLLKDYRVTASMGHVRDLPASQLGGDVEHGYAPSHRSSGKEKLVRELKAEAKADGVLLATDPDREEAISWHLANILRPGPACSPPRQIKACGTAWSIRAPSTWTCSTPSRPGGSWIAWWATSFRRFCGYAAFRRAR